MNARNGDMRSFRRVGIASARDMRCIDALKDKIHPGKHSLREVSLAIHFHNARRSRTLNNDKATGKPVVLSTAPKMWRNMAVPAMAKATRPISHKVKNVDIAIQKLEDIVADWN